MAADAIETKAIQRMIRANRRKAVPRGVGTGSGRGIGFPLSAAHETIKPERLAGTRSREPRRSDMTIAAILATKGSEVMTIDSEAPLTEAVSELARHRIGALVVTRNGSILGIFSERDLVTCVGKQGAAALDKPVGEAMTAPAVSVERGTAVLSALALMTQRRFRHLPIVERGELLGIVSIGDLVKYRIEAIEREAEAMRSYIQGA